MCFVYLTEPGMKLSKSDGTYMVGDQEKLRYQIPAETVEGIVMMGSTNITSSAVVDVLKRKIPVSWVTSSGEFCGSFQPPSGQQALKQQKQVLMQDTPFSLEMGKKFIQAKINNQIALLRRCNRTAGNEEVKMAADKMKIMKKEVMKSLDRNQLLGIEGISARLYFQSLSKMVKKDFAFAKRSTRPPKDSFNAMLSFGYTLLSSEIYTAVKIQGLHPYFGSLHVLRDGHAALVSDLLEEWRAVVVDAMVWSLIQHNEIRPEHFEKSSKGKGIFLTRAGKEIFLHGYEKKMRSTHVVNGYRYTLRQCIRQQCYQYSRALMQENSALYTAYTMR